MQLKTATKSRRLLEARAIVACVKSISLLERIIVDNAISTLIDIPNATFVMTLSRCVLRMGTVSLDVEILHSNWSRSPLSMGQQLCRPLQLRLLYTFLVLCRLCMRLPSRNGDTARPRRDLGIILGVYLHSLPSLFQTIHRMRSRRSNWCS